MQPGNSSGVQVPNARKRVFPYRVYPKKQLESEKSLYSILQILSVNVYEQEPLHQVLRDSPSQILEGNLCNQLVFNY
jgi:hypothetical protein